MADGTHIEWTAASGANSPRVEKPMPDSPQFTDLEKETGVLRGEILLLCSGKRGDVILNALAQVLAAVANSGPGGADIPRQVADLAESYQRSLALPALTRARMQ